MRFVSASGGEKGRRGRGEEVGEEEKRGGGGRRGGEDGS